jgi:hypothetical protein
MNTLLGNTKSIFGGVIALAFGAFWAYCAFTVRANGAGEPTFLGILGLATLSGFAGLIQLLRGAMGSARPAPRSSQSTVDLSAGGPDGTAHDFDADAAIARYLERKGAGLAENPDLPPIAPRPAPPFGRKVA